MSYETVIRTVSGQSGNSLLGLFDLYQRGVINRVEFLETGAQVLATANARSAAAGEAIFRDYMERATGQPYTIAAASRPWNPERLQKALATILADDTLDTLMQLERIAAAEPLKAGRRSYERAMQRERRVQGWTRGLDVNACQLCVWWWRQGRVWHKDHPMPAHDGCLCHQVPTITTTSNYQTAQQSERAMQRTDERNNNE